jgi:hypothetical protein
MDHQRLLSLSFFSVLGIEPRATYLLGKMNGLFRPILCDDRDDPVSIARGYYECHSLMKNNR